MLDCQWKFLYFIAHSFCNWLTTVIVANIDYCIKLLSRRFAPEQCSHSSRRIELHFSKWKLFQEKLNDYNEMVGSTIYMYYVTNIKWLCTFYAFSFVSKLQNTLNLKLHGCTQWYISPDLIKYWNCPCLLFK